MSLLSTSTIDCLRRNFFGKFAPPFGSYTGQTGGNRRKLLVSSLLRKPFSRISARRFVVARCRWAQGGGAATVRNRGLHVTSWGRGGAAWSYLK